MNADSPEHGGIPTGDPQAPPASAADPVSDVVEAVQEAPVGTATATATAPPSPSAGPEDPFVELSEAPAAGDEASLSLLYDLRMPVSVELGRSVMAIREVLALRRGSLIQLDRLAGHPVDVFVGDRKLGKGEVVVLGDHFGIRLTEIVSGAIPPAGEL